MKYKEIISESKSIKFYKDLKTVCAKRRLEVEVVGDIGKYKFLKMVINPNKEPTLLISAGIHGDEPAGPYGILDWLERAEYPEDLRIIILPLLNPNGFDNNERENGDDRDLNRGFNVRKKPTQEIRCIEKSLDGESLTLLLSLHEDSGHGGIYLYHADVDEDVCREIIDRCSKILPIVREKTVYGDKCDDGMIYISVKNSDPKHAYSLENMLQSLGVSQITFETPALGEFSKRKGLHAFMIQQVIDNFQSLTS